MTVTEIHRVLATMHREAQRVPHAAQRVYQTGVLLLLVATKEKENE